jgi:hypothetical protein
LVNRGPKTAATLCARASITVSDAAFLTPVSRKPGEDAGLFCSDL